MHLTGEPNASVRLAAGNFGFTKVAPSLPGRGCYFLRISITTRVINAISMLINSTISEKSIMQSPPFTFVSGGGIPSAPQLNAL